MNQWGRIAQEITKVGSEIEAHGLAEGNQLGYFIIEDVSAQENVNDWS